MILDCANAVIANNKERMPKNLWTQKENKEKVKVVELENANKEAQYAADVIKDLVGNQGYANSDIVVLYRTNAQSRYFEEALSREGIPYKTIGSISFYARAEIKDILAYLSLIDNPKDDLSLLRIINVPKRGIGEKTIAALDDYKEFKGWSYYETIQHLEEVPGLTTAQKKKFLQFRDLIEDLRSKIEDQELSEKIRIIYEDTGYKTLLESEKVENGSLRKENVEELVTAAKQFTMTSDDISISAFLENAALSSSTEEMDNEGTVSLMTLHSAKGLEFPVVFLTGLEEDIFPSYRSIQTNDIEEERRLCYVGITRAQEKLYITYANERMQYGNLFRHLESRFIDELPKDKIEVVYPNGKINKRVRKRSDNIYKSIELDKVLKHTQTIERSSEEIGTGDRVKHSQFGQGMVVEVGKNGLLTIAFPGIGIKKIVDSFVTKV